MEKSEYREQPDAGARDRLERIDGVVVGRNQIRIDLEVAGDRWRDLLLDTLQAAAGAELVA